MQRLIGREFEVVTDIHGPQGQRLPHLGCLGQMRDKLTVKQRAAQAVSQCTAWGKQCHGVPRHFFVVHPDGALPICLEQEQIALHEVKSLYRASKSTPEKVSVQFKDVISNLLGIRSFVRYQGLQGIHPRLSHCKTLTHRGHEGLTDFLLVGDLSKKLHETEYHNMFFVPFKTLVDLGARSKQLDTELGQPLGPKLLPEPDSLWN